MVSTPTHRKYLQYDTQPQKIYDLHQFEFDSLKRVVKWHKIDNSLKFECETDSGRTAHVQLDFINPRLFRIWLTVEKTKQKTHSEITVDFPTEAFALKVEESKDSIRIHTGQMIVTIRTDSWQVIVNDLNGKCIFSENAYGGNRSWFPVYRLGFRKSGDAPATCYESFYLRADEHIYGLGEKFGRMDKVGLHSVAWQSDTTNTVSERAYKNIPFFMSSYGYGIFINTSNRIDYEIGSESYVATSFLVHSPELEYFFIYGPDFRRILSQYTELTGRAPMPPRWSFGLWMSRFSYKNRDELEIICRELREYEVPCDVVHIDPDWMRPGHYCDLEWNEKSWHNRREMLDNLHKQGFHISLWEQPYVRPHTDMFKEGKEKGYFAKDTNGSVYLQSDFEDHPTAFIDFSHPEAAEWIRQKHLRLLEEGADVFKTDMGESVPEDAIFHNGMTGAEMHNLYPLLYNKTVFEAVDRHTGGKGIVWGRSAWAGSQRYPLNWAGDCHSTYEDMACTLRSGLSYGLSGVPFWSHDIGGFQGPPPSPELYIRWAQFGLLCSHSRCHGVGPHEPWHFGEEALRIFKKFAKLRYRLLPYLWATAFEATQNGLPVIRPMLLEFQNDPAVWHLDLQYMLGNALLVAPVFNPDGKVTVYLPAGNWLDYWQKELVSGPRYLELKVGLDTIPIYMRENTILPHGPAMNYVDEKPFNPLTVDIFVNQQAELTLWHEQPTTIRVQRDQSGVQIRTDEIEAGVTFNIYDQDKPRNVIIAGEVIEEATAIEILETRDCGWHYRSEKRILAIKTESESKSLLIEIK
ncbi:alpha-xylosidase [candidate division KSB1 bacterium]|nr:alpha-xylosidase [candidate division KSB1 bacterium]